MDSVTGLASGANFEGVIRIEEEKIRSHVGEVVRQTVEETSAGIVKKLSKHDVRVTIRRCPLRSNAAQIA